MECAEAPKKFKNQPHPLVRPSSVNFCQNFWNLSHETVPLMKKASNLKITLTKVCLIGRTNRIWRLSLQFEGSFVNKKSIVYVLRNSPVLLSLYVFTHVLITPAFSIISRIVSFFWGGGEGGSWILCHCCNSRPKPKDYLRCVAHFFFFCDD